MRSTSLRRRPASAASTLRNGSSRYQHPVEKTLAALRRAEDNLDAKFRDDPPDSWWKSIEDVIDAVVAWSIDAPASDLQFIHLCQPTAATINGYLEGIDNSTDEHGDPITAPHVSLTRGLSALLTAKPHEWPKIEPLQQLEREKVPHVQIAKMHGLKPYEVSEILAGTMEYPKGHITQHERDQRAVQKAARDKLRLAAARWKARRELEAEEAAITAESMLEDGATVGEIAEEFGVDEEAVFDAAEEAGFEEHDQDDEESAAIEATIIDLYKAGHANKEIAEVTGESIQRVAAIVRICQRSEATSPALADKPAKQSAASKVSQKKRRAAKSAKR